MPHQQDESFIELINTHLRIAHKICRVYTTSSDEHKDLQQEMMYQLWKSYTDFDGRSKFSTWMYRVCLNTALTYRRKDKTDRYESLSDYHFEIAEHTEQKMEEQMKVLFLAIGTLSPLNKAIVLLYLDDLSYEEIAGITGLTKSNVSVRLVRIKKELEMFIKSKTREI
jgi:RNA polymerase sigma factor (sigma-70 family)